MVDRCPVRHLMGWHISSLSSSFTLGWGAILRIYSFNLIPQVLSRGRILNFLKQTNEVVCLIVSLLIYSNPYFSYNVNN